MNPSGYSGSPMAKKTGTIPSDLELAINSIYTNIPLSFTSPEPEPESAEYSAFTFSINDRAVKYRISKLTPAKTGQFVTIWQRNGSGPIEPLHISNAPDLVVISARKGELIGQFIFPKDLLLEKGVISGNGKEGKRGIRIYPPWDKGLNKQAAKTQEWQLKCFLDITGETVDLTRALRLYSINN